MPITPAKRQVGFTEVVQGPRATAADFGAAEAGAVAQLGGAVDQVGSQISKLVERQDTFVAQKAYNQSVDVAQNLAAEASKLQGELAIGARARVEAGLDAEVEKLVKGMSPRQKKMFDRNWTFRRNGYINSVGDHEHKQTQKAFISEKGVLVEAAKKDFALTEDPAAYSAGLTALEDSMAALGLGADERQARREAYESDANSARFDVLIKSLEFDQAEKFVDTFQGEKKTIASLALENARTAEQNRRDSQEAKALQQGKLTEAYEIIQGGAGYTPPESRYQEWFGRELGSIRYTERLSNATQAIDAQASFENRGSLYAGAQALLKSIHAGDADADAAFPVIDALDADGSASSSYLKTKIQKALDSYMPGEPNALELADTGIMQKALREFNSVNDMGGWGQVFPGTVETTPTGSINTDNEATTAFYNIQAGWEQYKKDAESTNGPLTLKTLQELEKEYFYGSDGVLLPVAREKFRQRVMRTKAFDPSRPRSKGMFFDEEEALIRRAQERLLEELRQQEQPKG